MMNELETRSNSSCPSCSTIPGGGEELHKQAAATAAAAAAAGASSNNGSSHCCIGVPHRLQYPATAAAAASGGGPSGGIMDSFQMKQSPPPAWCNQFCTKLPPQFQFFTRLFQNSMLSKPLFDAQQQRQQQHHQSQQDQQQQQQQQQQQEQAEQQRQQAAAAAAASSTASMMLEPWNSLLHTGMNVHSGPGSGIAGGGGGINFPSLNTGYPSSSSCMVPPSSFSWSQGPPTPNNTGFLHSRASDFTKQQGYMFGKDDFALGGVARPPSCSGTGSCLLCHPKMMDLAMMNQQFPAMGIPVLPKHLQFPPVSNLQPEGEKDQHVSSSSQLRTRWPSLRIGGDPHSSFQQGIQGKVSGEQSSLASSMEAVGPQGNFCSVESPSGETRSHRSRVKGQWSLGEDKSLVKLVKQYGTRRWSLISTFMANRSGKQCRERWVNHLQPDIRKEGWTKEEEELLVQAHSYFGNKWSAIAKMLPGRTDNSIKNHWHAALRKKDRHGKLRSNLLREYIQQKLAKNETSPQQEGTETTSSTVHEQYDTKAYT